MTKTTIITNPILSGMYPDPSWIWDASHQQIALVNSSFELVPGLPIHVSTDFAHWEHVSDAINADMARRLLIPFVEDSGGVYAPTLRKIRGKYVIACTIARINEEKAVASGCSQDELAAARCAQGNFILMADAIEGPWRGPFWISGAEGIDPDIFEDEDGAVYWTQTRPAVHPQWEGQTEVWTQRIDPNSWTLIEDGKPAGIGKTIIWRGYGMEAVWAEGPHLYRIGDYVYLMTAEGGTSFEHSEMAMRIYAPNGLREAYAQYEQEASQAGEHIPSVRENERCYLGQNVRAFHANKKNPILTHRHLGLSESLQCVGHSDLLRHPTLGWWLVCLGVRETLGENAGELLSYLGRESFVAPVSWEHNPADWKLEGSQAPTHTEADPGWPIICDGFGRLPDEIGVVVSDDGQVLYDPFAGSSCEGASPVLLEVSGGTADVMVVRDSSDVKYRRIAGLPCLMPVPHEGTLVVRQNSANYAKFTMRGAFVECETAADGNVQVHPQVEIRPSARAAVLFGQNRLSVIAGQESDLSDPNTFVENGYVLTWYDARFLSTERAGGFVGCMAGYTE